MTRNTKLKMLAFSGALTVVIAGGYVIPSTAQANHVISRDSDGYIQRDRVIQRENIQYSRERLFLDDGRDNKFAIQTNPATNPAFSTATIHGQVTAGTGTNSVRFKYGGLVGYVPGQFPDPPCGEDSFTTYTPSSSVTGTGTFKSDLTGLSGGSRYCFRAEKADGTIKGSALKFSTDFEPQAQIYASPKTDPATNITLSTATLNGSWVYFQSGGSGTPLPPASPMNIRFKYGFAIGSSGQLATCDGAVIDTPTPAFDASTSAPYSQNLSGLTPNTWYCFRVEKSDGTKQGQLNAFKTSASTATIQTSFAVVSSENSLAELYGKVIGTTSTETTNVRFKYGPRTDANCVVGDLTTYTSSYAQTGAGQFNIEVQNLVGGTTYCFRAEKSDGSMLGAIKVFYINPPIILTTGVAYEYEPGSVYMTGTANQSVGNHFMFTYGLKMGSVCSPSDLTSYVNAYSTGTNGEHRSNNVIGLASGEYCFRAETVMGDVADNIEKFSIGTMDTTVLVALDTLPASRIASSSALLNAEAYRVAQRVPDGLPPIVTGPVKARFKYGVAMDWNGRNLDSESACSERQLTNITEAFQVNTPGAYSAQVNRLQPNTVYCFAVEDATNRYIGKILRFRTTSSISPISSRSYRR